MAVAMANPRKALSPSPSFEVAECRGGGGGGGSAGVTGGNSGGGRSGDDGRPVVLQLSWPYQVS